MWGLEEGGPLREKGAAKTVPELRVPSRSGLPCSRPLRGMGYGSDRGLGFGGSQLGSVGLRRRHVAPLGIPVDHTFETTWQGPMEDRKDRRSTVERDAPDETIPDDDDARRKMQVRRARTDSRVRAERWRGWKREVDVWTVPFAMVRSRSGNPTDETGGWILSLR